MSLTVVPIRQAVDEAPRHEQRRRRETCRACWYSRALSETSVDCRYSGSRMLSLLSDTCPDGKWNEGSLLPPSAPTSPVPSLKEQRRRTDFDRVVVINLSRRADRWEGFQERLAAADWPFCQIERAVAVDGRKSPPPKWWNAGPGAWGCHQSHVKILEEALRDGIETLLILEDDALLCHDFARRARDFMERVPHDWDALLLGGQHLVPPTCVASGVMRVRNGNRTHAHAMRGRYIRAAYRHLCDYVAHAERPMLHVDHRLGELHRSGRFNVYAPSKWLISQAPGWSDVCCKALQERRWDRFRVATSAVSNRRSAAELPPVVVMGGYRCGTSCTAGVLFHLGFHLGIKLLPGNAANPDGYYEPLFLRHRLRQLYDEPSFRHPRPRAERIDFLRSWLDMQRTAAAEGGRRIAVKHPILMMAGDDLLEAWGEELSFVRVWRDPTDAHRSLRQCRWWRPDVAARALERILDAGDKFLAARHHCQVRLIDLTTEPRREVLRLARSLELHCSEEEIASAVSSVRGAIDEGVTR